jgi:hypothetical protein
MDEATPLKVSHDVAQELQRKIEGEDLSSLPAVARFANEACRPGRRGKSVRARGL